MHSLPANDTHLRPATEVKHGHSPFFLEAAALRPFVPNDLGHYIW
jgi:hypothetical protein